MGGASLCSARGGGANSCSALGRGLGPGKWFLVRGGVAWDWHAAVAHGGGVWTLHVALGERGGVA